MDVFNRNDRRRMDFTVFASCTIDEYHQKNILLMNLFMVSIRGGKKIGRTHQVHYIFNRQHQNARHYGQERV